MALLWLLIILFCFAIFQAQPVCGFLIFVALAFIAMARR